MLKGTGGLEPVVGEGAGLELVQRGGFRSAEVERVRAASPLLQVDQPQEEAGQPGQVRGGQVVAVRDTGEVRGDREPGKAAVAGQVVVGEPVVAAAVQAGQQGVVEPDLVIVVAGGARGRGGDKGGLAVSERCR